MGCITTGIHGTKIANYIFPCEGHEVCMCHYDVGDDSAGTAVNETSLFTPTAKTFQVSLSGNR